MAVTGKRKRNLNEDENPTSGGDDITDDTSSSAVTDDEEDASNSESEDEVSEDSDSAVDTTTPDGDVVTLPSQPRPDIASLPRSDLRSRLSTFLPQLRDANADLERGHVVDRLDDVADDEEHYIEMDLGLGVLKEVKEPENGIKTTAGDTSSNDTDQSEDDDVDALQKALGSSKTKPGIEELNAG